MYDTEDNDTIVSLATPPGRGGIAIIRLSGPRSVETVRGIFSRDIPEGQSHRLYYGHITDPDTGETVDEVMVGVMRAPRSYTREDVVEINCHGGPVQAARVLGLVSARGARPAEPGEFTMRAFLSGRIDLSQAEAVLDVINARSLEAGRLAMGQLTGRLSEKVSALRQSLIDVLSEIEAHIDFPEEEIEPASIERISKAIISLVDDIDGLRITFDSGRLFRDGLRTAIVGRPNVGKSSLLNALVSEEKAIVADMPGTTRDVVEDFITIKGMPVRVMDTAGIRESHEMVEQEGVRRSLKALGEADLVVAVFDASQPLHDEDRLVLERIEGKTSVIVLNKTDLPGRMILEERLEKLACRISAQKGTGIDLLRDEIYRLATGGTGGYEGCEGVVITNERHRSALDRGASALEKALGSLEKEPLEVTALELRESLQSLGSIVGDITPDDILENIFSRFCIGK